MRLVLSQVKHTIFFLTGQETRSGLLERDFYLILEFCGLKINIYVVILETQGLT